MKNMSYLVKAPFTGLALGYRVFIPAERPYDITSVARNELHMIGGGFTLEDEHVESNGMLVSQTTLSYYGDPVAEPLFKAGVVCAEIGILHAHRVIHCLDGRTRFTVYTKDSVNARVSIEEIEAHILKFGIH